MASSNNEGGDGMLARMVKRVASTGGREAPVPGDPSASQFAEAEKAELKAMIERKRRNDFVRKRELNMLRRIRREGLSPDQAAALEASSRLDDSEVRATQPPGAADLGVKAKIDAIEQQMVGGGAAVPAPLQGASPPNRSGSGILAAVSRRVGLGPRDDRPTVPAGMLSEPFGGTTRPMMMMPADTPAAAAAPATAAAAALAIKPLPAIPEFVPTLHTPATEAMAQMASAAAAAPAAPPAPLPSVEVTELAHDHELDEAVIAFANADFAHCERALVMLVSPKGLRYQHEDTWLALFDLYRATGQQLRFDALSQEFAQHFQKSPPQWYSLPKLVAEAASTQTTTVSAHGQVGWVCAPRLDADGLANLISQTLQLPQPWVMDWTALTSIDTDAVNQLHALLRQWAEQPLEMRWLASDRLFAVLQESAPVGVRDADPGYWLARLQALRLVNRPDQFDEAAIDYCVTYEVSPPSWEPTKGIARVGGSAANTQTVSLSVVGEPITTIQGGGMNADSRGVAITTLELSGQLSGDISAVLSALDAKLGGAQIVRISCALLIRVDFIAGGDLLNWVTARQSEGRHIGFIDVHRLVALMFGAMGITEHAPVHLRQA